MVRLAIQPLAPFRALSWEIERPDPSYTIDTVQRFHLENPDAQLHLILREDALEGLSRWKESAELLRLAPPLIGSRSATAPEMFQAMQKGWTKIPTMEISSTEIRDRLKKHLFCGHLLPTSVLDYIQTHSLYNRT
jgi:nicotinate-nucleotide adenylyltransferase